MITYSFLPTNNKSCVCFYLPFSKKDDYRSHTTCTMTEVDNLVADRGGRNGKKQSPQEAWMELLVTSIEMAPPAIKSQLQQMVQLDNIPRKEKQFRNFAMNSLNLRGGALSKKVLDAIWRYLSEQRERMKKQKEEKNTKQAQHKQQKEQPRQSKLEEESNVTADDDACKTTTMVAAVSDKDDNDNDNDNTDSEIKKTETDDKAIYKNVKKATKKILKKAAGQSMKYKSLQKALRETVSGIPKKQLKEVMKLVVTKESKKIVLEGKQIKLIQ